METYDLWEVAAGPQRPEENSKSERAQEEEAGEQEDIRYTVDCRESSTQISLQQPAVGFTLHLRHTAVAHHDTLLVRNTVLGYKGRPVVRLKNRVIHHLVTGVLDVISVSEHGRVGAVDFVPVSGRRVLAVTALVDVLGRRLQMNGMGLPDCGDFHERLDNEDERY